MHKIPNRLRGEDISSPYNNGSALREMLSSISPLEASIPETRPLPKDFFGAPSNITPSVDMSESVDVLKGILKASEIRNYLVALKRGLIGTTQSIGTIPVKIIQSQFTRGYIISNPTFATGKANTGVFLPSQARAIGTSGNTILTPLDVSDYREIKLYLNITANAGLNTIQIDALTQDPFSGLWASSQLDAFSSPAAVGTYYEDLGSLGVDQNFAIGWTVTNVGGGTATFSLSYVLKDASSAFSLANTIYVGSAGVTSVAGYPILEGKELPVVLDPNVEIWAVSNVVAGLGVRIFELQ